MRRENGRVVIEISEEEFESLLLCLGYATGAASAKPPGYDDHRHRTVPLHEYKLAESWLRLANSINKGNPQWTPYKIPKKVPVP
jgi:hypothetical protein